MSNLRHDRTKKPVDQAYGVGTEGNMPIQYVVLRKKELLDPTVFCKVEHVAEQLRTHLNEPQTQNLLKERHIIGASSASIQELIQEEAQRLGFHSEKKGLFCGYAVSALRPDYYCPVGASGILLEVERRSLPGQALKT